MTDPLVKGLPQNLEAERCVLAAVISDPLLVPKATSVLTPDDFALEAHRKIFRCVAERYESGASVDRVSVAEMLNGRDQLQPVGGLTYLMDLDNSLPQLFGIDSYVQIVREKSILRRFLLASEKLSDLCYRGDLTEVSEQAETMLREIGQAEGPASVGLKHASEILADAGGVGGLFAPRKFGVPTPFPALNDLTCGFHGGQLIIIAGRPGKGKSALACQLVEHAVSLNAGACAVFSLEMSAQSMLSRMSCSAAGVNSNLVRHGRLEREQRKKLQCVATALAESPLYISDKMKVTLPAIHNALRWLKANVRLSMVCVDYLQLMSSSGQSNNRTQEVSALSRGLKEAAVEFDVPFLVLSQFNREAVKDGRPRLDHLRESGSIEQDCDMAMLLHEPNGESGPEGWEVDLLLEKQREGPTGEVPLWFDRGKTRFEQRGEQQGEARHAA